MRTYTRYYFATAVVILLVGFLITDGILQMSDLRMMPSDLADIYREKQISLTVPGAVELRLNRLGVYGIYYHYSLVTSAWKEIEIPPEIECSLASETGDFIKGVPDYVPSNRYWEKDNGGPAVLIQSITVDEPGVYQFSCQYPEGLSGPGFQISLGPNYTWEMIRLILDHGLALLFLIFSLPSAIMISGVLILAGIICGKTSSGIQIEGTAHNHQNT